MNISSFLYLNAAVSRYKKESVLPRWAERSRLFLDNMDDTIKPYEVEEVDAAIKELGKAFDFFQLKDFSPMPFLQIRPDKDNKYDVRDDYEFGQAVKNLNKPGESDRKDEEAKQPLKDIHGELFEAAKSDPDVDINVAQKMEKSESATNKWDEVGDDLETISK